MSRVGVARFSPVESQQFETLTARRVLESYRDRLAVFNSTGGETANTEEMMWVDPHPVPIAQKWISRLKGRVDSSDSVLLAVLVWRHEEPDPDLSLLIAAKNLNSELFVVKPFGFTSRASSQQCIVNPEESILRWGPPSAREPVETVEISVSFARDLDD